MNQLSIFKVGDDQLALIFHSKDFFSISIVLLQKNSMLFL